jgi:tRNA 5-methylaminomethyl-2-thiouridine biosynthesis bifunctional protein
VVTISDSLLNKVTVLSEAIQTASLDWQCVDGIEIPVSRQFGDVYFSKDNGLLETRHVFLNGNDLTERLSALQSHQYFCVGETGFGTGLNILALWQLWQECKPDNHSHLHAVSVEKFPLSKSDLIRALNAWPELKPLAELLIEQYPLPVAGCHRLNFPEHRFSLDLWLGDAHDVFPQMPKTSTVNAWFLDGFAPSCNPDMWEENVLNHIVRLSDTGTTFSSFSVAGVLKRGLRSHGIKVTRPRGFGHKREMLKAVWLEAETETDTTTPAEHSGNTAQKKTATDGHSLSRPRQIAIIGAGIAGLSCAWSLAQRGHQVSLYDRTAPLTGASGNPLALLNPKLGSIAMSDYHLMTVTWQYALRHYRQFSAFHPLAVHQIALKKAEESLALADDYPENLLQKQPCDLKTEYPSLLLTQAGAVSPHLLCEEILQHPLIDFHQADIQSVEFIDEKVQLKMAESAETVVFDHAVICAAKQSSAFFELYPVLRPIRGQVSWLDNADSALSKAQAYSYGGYCMQLNDQQLILGASFLPGREDTDVLEDDHVHNLELIHNVFPQYAESLAPVSEWQGRASIRAQTPDFFPVLGRLDENSEIYTYAGLGSKGFLYSPLCGEIMAALILKEACPVPDKLLKQLNPLRFRNSRKAPKKYHATGEN